MNDQQRQAFIGGLIGGFAAVGAVQVAMQFVQIYRSKAFAEQLQEQSNPMAGGLGDDWA